MDKQEIADVERWDLGTFAIGNETSSITVLQ